MALAPKVARVRFARFIERALRDARSRGLTDRDIYERTNVRPSTFHRWQTDQGGLPKWQTVEAFCRGLDIPPAAAAAALGITGDERQATPEAPLDPDLSRLARILADPAVPEEEKRAIRHTIRMLARAALTDDERAERRRTDRTGNTGGHDAPEAQAPRGHARS